MTMYAQYRDIVVTPALPPADPTSGHAAEPVV